MERHRLLQEWGYSRSAIHQAEQQMQAERAAYHRRNQQMHMKWYQLLWDKAFGRRLGQYGRSAFWRRLERYAQMSNLNQPVATTTRTAATNKDNKNNCAIPVVRKEQKQEQLMDSFSTLDTMDESTHADVSCNLGDF